MALDWISISQGYVKQIEMRTYIFLSSHAHDGYSNRHDSMLPFPLQFLEYAKKYFAACLNWKCITLHIN